MALPGGVRGRLARDPLIPLHSPRDQNGKAIIFGTKSRFGLRFGVLTAWIVCGTAALVLTTMYKRRSAKKQKQQQQEEKEREERQREKRESRPENGEKRPIWLQ